MRVYPDLTPDGEFQTLGTAGYDGSMNDRQYKFLRDQGLLGALSDMLYVWRNNPFVSYGVGGIVPELIEDFVNERYTTDGRTADSFSDSITHSAASNATMVDSDGLLKWRPHNLLTYSEQFDNAAWGKAAATTITANTAVSPDVTQSADTWTTTGAPYPSVFQTVTVSSGVAYTTSVFAKAGTLSTLGIEFRGAGSTQDALFDLANGTVSSGSGLIEDYGNGWYRCSITKTSVDTSELVIIGAGSGGVSAGNLYIWGAHLYRSDLGGMVAVPADARATPSATTYVPTTTSAVYLPRRGHHVYNGDSWVNKGLLHESEARTNLVIESNDLSTHSGVRATLSVDQATSPSGETDAGSVIETAVAGDHRLDFDAISVTTGTAYTFSAFIKPAGRNWVRVQLGTGGFGTAYANFDLSNGSAGTTTGITTAQTEDVGNGWYRCIITATATATAATTISLQLATADNGISYTGDGTSGVYIYGAQLEAGSTPSSYIPTSGATVTRSAETLTVPAANLPWPSPVVIGEELVTNGTFDANTSGWTANAYASLSVVSGSMRVENNAANLGLAYQAISLEAGKTYQFSANVVSINGVSAQFTLNTSNVYSTNVAGSTNYTVGIQSFNYSPSLSGTYYIVLAQRGSNTLGYYADFDNISVKEINPLSVSIQMQGEMTYADTDQTTEVAFFNWSLDANNFIIARMRTNAGSAGTGIYNFLQAQSGTIESIFGPELAGGVNVPFNIASRHGSTFINGAVDGTALTADLTPVALPDLSATDLQLGYDYMGTISLFRIWADDLTDAGIAEASA